MTHRFLRAIEDEQQQRRENPAVLSAAGESLPRTFLEIARHRLSGATFDSLLQEALNACEQSKAQEETSNASPVKVIPFQSKSSSLPVVVSPDPDPADQAL